MLKTKSFYLAILIAGVCLFGVSIIGRFLFEMPKIVAGIGVGVGTTLLGVGLPNFLKKYLETIQPEMMKQNQIEFQDERNTMIRNKAKAKAGDITQWFIMGTFYIAILAEVSQWIFFALVGIYLLKNILEMTFNIKYQKEL
jgi:hypothetical protein